MGVNFVAFCWLLAPNTAWDEGERSERRPGVAQPARLSPARAMPSHSPSQPGALRDTRPTGAGRASSPDEPMILKTELRDES